MDQIDLANPPKSLDDYIDKRIKAGTTKLRRELKKSKRLNCLGDAKIQGSAPTKHGTSSKKVRFADSTKQSSSQKRNKKKSTKEDTSPKKTRKSNKKNQQHAKQPKSGSRGESKREGKQKGTGKK